MFYNNLQQYINGVASDLGIIWEAVTETNVGGGGPSFSNLEHLLDQRL